MSTLTTTTMDFITTAASVTTVPVALGYVAVLVAVVFFGSNFMPVKKFYSGNGIFFQWVLCSGIWSTGIVCTAVRGFPQYRPLPMIGGLLWCTGNMLTVPIINSIGLAKGLLVWGSFNLLTGWASSRFGWLGIKAQVPKNIGMNYAGVVLCLVSACIYLFMRTSGTEKPQADARSGSGGGGGELNRIKSEVDQMDHPDLSTSAIASNNESLLSRHLNKKPIIMKIVGTIMAVIAGIFYGTTFIPVVYLKDNFEDYSKNGLDYVFAHYCGIYTASTLYFIIYCMVSKNNPVIYPNIILPGFVSGAMWGIACIAWFVANDSLSESISFPIITTLPGIIGTFWGLLFREIKGWKNYLVLAVAISIGIVGSVLTGLSK